MGGSVSLTHMVCLVITTAALPQNGEVCGAGLHCCNATRAGHWGEEAVSVGQKGGVERAAPLCQSLELGCWTVGLIPAHCLGGDSLEGSHLRRYTPEGCKEALVQEEYLQLWMVLLLSLQPPSTAQVAASSGQQCWSPALHLSHGDRFLPRGFHL